MLALLSVVPVAWSLQVHPEAWQLANEGWQVPPIDWRPMGPVGALALAIAAILPAALLGGWIGTKAWQRSHAGGVLAAISIAWVVGILVLPVAAAVLGVPLRAGIVCSFGCEAMLRDDQLHSGLVAAIQLHAVSLAVAPLQLVPLALYWVGRRRRRVSVSIAAVLLFHAIAQTWYFSSWVTGSRLPYLALVVGVVIWALWMVRRDAAAQGSAIVDPHGVGPDDIGAR